MPYTRYHTKRALHSGRSLERLAQEMGVSPNTLQHMFYLGLEIAHRDMCIRELVNTCDKVTQALAIPYQESDFSVQEVTSGEDGEAHPSLSPSNLESTLHEEVDPPKSIAARYGGERRREPRMGPWKKK